MIISQVSYRTNGPLVIYMYMSLVNHNKSSEVISAAESLEFCRVRTCTCTNLYGVSQRNKEDTRKRSFCLYFLYFLLSSLFAHLSRRLTGELIG